MVDYHQKLSAKYSLLRVLLSEFGVDNQLRVPRRAANCAALECSTLWNTIRIPSYSLKFSNARIGRDPLGRDCYMTEVQVQRAIRRTKEAELRIN